MAKQLPRRADEATPALKPVEQVAVPPRPAAPRPAVGYFAAIYPGPAQPLPSDFARAVLSLEKTLKMPIWLLVHPGTGKFGLLDENLVNAFLMARNELPDQKPVALLIHSLGGFAKPAYQIATILRNRCGAFIAIVPKHAKSAATLLSFGGNPILLGTDAELGPLDAQFIDPEREDIVSALDEVQALERLHAFALEALDRTMVLFVSQSGKKIETLLPMTLEFVNGLVRPLFEKIDAVHYTQRSRALKVAEEYAIRLLQAHYSANEAAKIARHFVSRYPDHEFLVDAHEAAKIGLRTASMPSKSQQRIMDSMLPHLDQRLTAIGPVKEVHSDGQKKRR